MDLISQLANFCISAVVSVLSKLFADEFKAWSPRLVSALVRSAVSRLPRQEQERYQEEWLSHLEEVPGEVSKLVSALSFQIASLRIERASLELKRAELPRAPALRSSETRARMNLTLGLLPEKKLDWRKFALSYGIVLCVLLVLLIPSLYKPLK
jgi:hypothetical protein